MIRLISSTNLCETEDIFFIRKDTQGICDTQTHTHKSHVISRTEQQYKSDKGNSSKFFLPPPSFLILQKLTKTNYLHATHMRMRPY